MASDSDMVQLTAKEYIIINSGEYGITASELGMIISH